MARVREGWRGRGRGREGNGVTNVYTRSNKPTVVALRSSTFLMYLIYISFASSPSSSCPSSPSSP